jgi:hypothetical protein
MEARVRLKTEYKFPMTLVLNMHQILLDSLFKHKLTPRVSNSVGLGQGLRMHSSKKGIHN